MLRYCMDTVGTHHENGRDMDVTHKKKSIGYDKTWDDTLPILKCPCFIDELSAAAGDSFLYMFCMQD